MLLLLFYNSNFGSSATYFFFATFPFWLFSGSLLLTPALFNPSGLEWKNVINDWNLWHSFFNDDVEAQDENHSWHAWFAKNIIKPMAGVPLRRRVMLILIPRSRKFTIFYGLCSFAARSTQHVNSGSLMQATRRFSTADMMLVCFTAIAIMMVVNMLQTEIKMRKRRKNASRRLVTSRIASLVLVLAVISTVFAFCLAERLRLITLGYLALASLFLSQWIVFDVILVLLPSWWFLCDAGSMRQRAQSTTAQTAKLGAKQTLKGIQTTFIQELMIFARRYHYIMGVMLLVPLVCTSFLPFLHELQMRLLFNPEYADELISAETFHKEHNRKQRQFLHYTDKTSITAPHTPFTRHLKLNGKSGPQADAPGRLEHGGGGCVRPWDNNDGNVDDDEDATPLETPSVPSFREQLEAETRACDVDPMQTTLYRSDELEEDVDAVGPDASPQVVVMGGWLLCRGRECAPTVDTRRPHCRAKQDQIIVSEHRRRHRRCRPRRHCRRCRPRPRSHPDHS